MATAAVMGAGALLQYEGGRQQARAAGRAASAQERIARQQMAFARQSQQQALAAAESPQELAALTKSLHLQEKNIKNQERLAEQIDPALLEAGQQALNLLQGKESRTLQPLREQRNLQRKQLLSSLREQLGPGADTSTAGIQALTRFDQETAGLLAGEQQRAFSSISGFLQTGQSARSNLGNQVASLANIGQGFGNIAQRKVNAITGGAAGISSAYGALGQAAGSRYVGAQLAGQQQAQLGSSLMQFGGALAGSDYSFGDFKNDFSNMFSFGGDSKPSFAGGTPVNAPIGSNPTLMPGNK